MIVLSHNIRMIALQFSFSNKKIVPTSIRHIPKETPKEFILRKQKANGVMIIQPVHQCSLIEFITDLENAKYTMVDALYQQRLNAGCLRAKYYHMIRFLFTRPEYARPSEELLEKYNNIKTELSKLCAEAMWRVRIFSNPWLTNNTEIPKQHVFLSINLEARQPLYHPNGQPVKMWQKDKNGKRMGDAPLPVQPNYYLRIINNIIKFVAN